MMRLMFRWSRLLNLNRLFYAYLVICCFVTSCGYRYGPDEGLPSRYSSISVPYIEGDIDGSFTTAVVKAIARSGTFEYRPQNGSLILYIAQVDEDTDNIGFRYDRKKPSELTEDIDKNNKDCHYDQKKLGKLTKDIIPVEARIISLVEISVVEAASGNTVLGPVRISGSVDYDHDFYFSRNGVNIFSLGQLIDLEEAYDAVQKPLYDVLAQKIVDYINQSW